MNDNPSIKNEKSSVSGDSGSAERDRTIERALATGREYGLTQLALNASLAKMIGSPPTDAWVLFLMQSWVAQEPLTAGDLARVTGLTTGAITKIVDRLEARGMAERTQHPSDRRKTVIVPTPETGQLTRAFEPMRESFRELAQEYGTAELRVVVAYLERSRAIVEETIGRLRNSEL